jgi:hypothetical protein
MIQENRDKRNEMRQGNETRNEMKQMREEREREKMYGERCIEIYIYIWRGMRDTWRG